jgi:hypothetical protein
MEGFSSVAREVSKALPFGAPLFGAKDRSFVGCATRS